MSGNLLFPELLLASFMLVCIPARHDFVPFARDRATLILVCTSWRRLIENCVLFWDCIHVTQRLPPRVLSLWLDRAKNARLDVELVFEDLHHYYRYGTGLSKVCFYAEEVLPLLLLKSLNWRSFRLVTEDILFAEHVLAILEGSLFRLESLELEFRNISFVRSLSDASLRVPSIPATILQTNPFQLERLSLSSATIPWSSVPSFEGLTHLELNEFHRQGFPSWDDFQHIFGATSQLQTLILRGVGCSTCGVFEEHSIYLPSLHTLEIEFRGVESLAALVGSLDMPNLSSVVIWFGMGYDVSVFARCLYRTRSLFESVLTLAIRGPVGSGVVAEFADLIFPQFPAVDTLDLIQADGEVFEQLVKALDDELTSGGNTLPVLEDVRVRGAAACSLRSFVDIRKNGPSRAIRLATF